MSTLEADTRFKLNPFYALHEPSDYSFFYITLAFCFGLSLFLLIINVYFCCFSEHQHYWTDSYTGTFPHCVAFSTFPLVSPSRSLRFRRKLLDFSVLGKKPQRTSTVRLTRAGVGDQTGARRLSGPAGRGVFGVAEEREWYLKQHVSLILSSVAVFGVVHRVDHCALLSVRSSFYASPAYDETGFRGLVRSDLRRRTGLVRLAGLSYGTYICYPFTCNFKLLIR